MERDGHLESIWQSEVKHYGQKEISPTPNFDVVIAGAGITGITSAIMLQKIIEGHHQVGIETFKTNVNPFGIPSVRVVEIPNQAQFHPLKYLRILLKEFIHNGEFI